MVFSPEVLAPVGSPESLAAAVRSGADAVYIGAKQFSARRNADNFDDNDIIDTVRYCHIRGVKVYLALNIMIKQSELQAAFDVALTAYKCGVDAIIISDLGLASLIHKHIPDLQLHASTQMTVHSPACLPMLKKLGFTRVVVSREMSKQELQNFCAAANETGIEVEVFVHGALCMSVSGQCLLSSVLGARSGNRGLCAGPCRLPFKAQNGTGYDLSLKDLCLYEYINELKEMGVASLKIEGRMKRPEYVSAATAACRQAVDNGFIGPKLFKTLQDVFSRSGFTDGYYNGNLGKDMFGIRTKDDVIAAGDTYSYLHELYRAERQSVSIKMDAQILADKPVMLTVSDDKNTVTVSGDIPQAAKTKALEKQTVIDNLTKLGNTPYYCEVINVRLDDGLFVAASALNALRRDAIEQLDNKCAEVNLNEYTVPNFDDTNNLNGKKQFIARFASVEQIPKRLGCIKIIILPYECEMPQIDGIEIVAELPRYIGDEAVVVKRLEYLKERGITTAYCGNLSAVAIAKSLGFKVIGAVGLNANNNETIKTLTQIGVDIQMLSAEISVKEIKSISSITPVGIFAYGRLPLMLTRNCPIKNGKTCAECDKKGTLVDRKGIEFPVMCRAGYSELLNSAPLYMGDRLQEVPAVDYLLLYFTNETQSQASEIINMYYSGKKTTGDYTRNLYYRDLI
ncbi:MAG: U32 family peptidase [Ruminococcaceae bacterium]|nr:U32 family peptidase [Oscillospiraceae bacterium]